MDQRLVFGLGLGLASLFVRWRFPTVPHSIANAGISVGICAMALAITPWVRVGPAVVGIAGVALLVFAVSWQRSPGKQTPLPNPPSPGPSAVAVSVPPPPASSESKVTTVHHVRAGAETGQKATLSMVVHRADGGHPAGSEEHGVAGETATPPTPAPPQPQRKYELSTEQKRHLLAAILPLKATLPMMVISRSGVAGGDTIMMQLAEVFERAGFKVETGFQQPTGPDQTGLFVCVSDIKHVPPIASKIQAALREIGFDAPIIALPPDATQNTVVIFAGPLPL